MARVSADDHPGLNFTISVPSVPGCTTANGDAQCYIPPGTTFTLDVTLEALPSDITSYEGIDALLAYTGLTSANNASMASWPDCAYPATSYDTGQVTMGCTVGLPPAVPSTYTGVVGTNDFTCTQSGAIGLPHGEGHTDLVEAVTLTHSEPGNADTLTIGCGSPPTPTPTPAPTPLPALVSSGSAGTLSEAGGNGSAALWLAIASLLTVAGAGFVVFGWRFARSR
jgi:hypothetical protein